MALPSGTFSHPDAGNLRIVFNGKWGIRYVGDAGFRDPDVRSGDLELILRAVVDDGVLRKTALMSASVNTAVFDIDYPGGYAPLALSFEYVTHTLAGISAVSASPLRISCYLTKPTPL